MTATAIQETERVRHMAERLDCFIEEDFQALAAATPKTVGELGASAEPAPHTSCLVSATSTHARPWRNI